MPKDSTNVQISESLEGLGVVVDKEASVIRGVKLIGLESRNGRSYPGSVLKAAVPHYEGVKVNIDHPDKPTAPRSLLSRSGVIRSARYLEGKGVFGDYHFNPKHQAAEQIAWDAENNPSAVGFSHNANLRISTKKGKSIVEAIAGVRSLDLVADPATTSGFFESEEGSTDESDNSTTPETEDKTLELKDMTLEQILEGREDIRNLIKKENDETLESLRAENEKLKTEKALATHLATVESELTESKLTAEQVSEAFRKIVQGVESKEDRAELIADRVAIFEGQKTPTKKPKTTPVQEGEKLTKESLLAAMRTR